MCPTPETTEPLPSRVRGAPTRAKPGEEADGLVATVSERFHGWRRVQAIVCGGFALSALAIGGVVEAIFPVPAPDPQAVEVRPETERWVDGSAQRRVEERLRTRSRLRDALAPYWSAALWHAFREIHPYVARGPDDTLYVADRLPLPATAEKREALISRNAARVAAVDRRLRAAGVELVVLVVPRKGAVAAARLPAGIPRAPETTRMVEAALDRLGVTSARLVDDPVVGPDLYPRFGSHWTDAGAVAAAERVAEALGRRLPARDRRLAPIPYEAEAEWDLLRNVGFRRRWGLERFIPIERGTAIDFHEHGRRVPRHENPERITDVLLVGTSYTVVSPLAVALRAATGADVFEEAELGLTPGHGMVKALTTMHRRGAPRAVVWELPEYHFTAPFWELSAVDPAFMWLPPWGFHDTGPILERELPSAVSGSPDADQSVQLLPEGVVLPGDGSFLLQVDVRAEALAVLEVGSNRDRVRLEIVTPGRSFALPLMGGEAISEARLRLRSVAGSAEIAAWSWATDLILLTGEVSAAAKESATGWRVEAVVPPVEGFGARDAVRIDVVTAAAQQATISGAPHGPVIELDLVSGANAIVLPLRDLGYRGGDVERISISGSGRAPDAPVKMRRLRPGFARGR